ncbi:MAG: glycosyltransferase [Ekhidna sp.]
MLTGIFPQYSQTYIIDQINKMRETKGDYSIEMGCVRDTGMRPVNASPEIKKHLVSSKPFLFRTVINIARNFVVRPSYVLRLFDLRRRGLIYEKTLYISLQVRKTPDLIVIHFGNHSDMVAQMKQYIFPEARTIVVLHGHDVSSFVKRSGWKFYKKVQPFVDEFISINRLWKDLLETNVPGAKCSVCYLGTEIPSSFDRIYRDQDEINLLSVGRHVEKKGHSDLLNALALVKNKTNRQVKLYLAGDGPKTQELTELSENLGLQENIVFLGAVSHKDVLTQIKKHDIFVLPSKRAQNGDSEGLPVAIMEAMAMGMPVISTYHSGIPELVSNKDNGLLVPEGDVEALSDAILKLVESTDERERLGKGGYQTVCDRHEIKKQTKEFVDLILD